MVHQWFLARGNPGLLLRSLLKEHLLSLCDAAEEVPCSQLKFLALPLWPACHESKTKVQAWAGGILRIHISGVDPSDNATCHAQNPTQLLAMNHVLPWPLSTVPARGYGDHHHQEAMVMNWARAAQGCQLHHQSCNPLDPRGKVEVWSTEDNLAKNCVSRHEEHEPQLGHHPEAGQWQTGMGEFHCFPTHQLAWR